MSQTTEKTLTIRVTCTCGHEVCRHQTFQAYRHAEMREYGAVRDRENKNAYSKDITVPICTGLHHAP